ncbi:hypothetical protein N0824_02645 [Microcystis sp. 0824]|nr:hypothetical protein N0824_02645 [Microcystis sp. 0824]
MNSCEHGGTYGYFYQILKKSLYHSKFFREETTSSNRQKAVSSVGLIVFDFLLSLSFHSRQWL